MNSKTTRAFWACYHKLPRDVQELASKQYRLWRADPFHPSMHFKQLFPGVWSVRIGIGHRALGRRTGNTIAWFWIGTHAEYDRLI